MDALRALVSEAERKAEDAEVLASVAERKAGELQGRAEDAERQVGEWQERVKEAEGKVVEAEGLASVAERKVGEPAPYTRTQSVIDSGSVGSGVPREQKMLKGHLPRVIYITKYTSLRRKS